MWIPVHRSWRVNERMYGALQGLDKAETAAKHGEAQVKIWRRSYDIPPPPMQTGRAAYSRQRIALREPRARAMPATESLKDTVERFLPYWESDIAPALRRGERVLIAAHGNSLRALVKHLDGDQRRRHRRAEHPDRRTPGLRARRRSPTDRTWALSRRSGGSEASRRRRRRRNEALAASAVKPGGSRRRG